MTPIYEYIGHIHVHTTASDGTLSHEEVARIAEETGLDFVIITDHNVLCKDKEGWYGKTLLLVGEEIHDVDRQPESSHYLAFDIEEDLASLAKNPQTLIDEVNARGGFGFLAHPFEHDTPPFVGEPNISWRDWEVTGYTGLELWNYMSEFKGHLANKALAVLFCYFPRLAIMGPYPETLAKWDELLRNGRVAIIAGSDVHAHVYRLGPLARRVFPYRHTFRALNTHILTHEPLNGRLEHDKGVIYRALREGRAFIAYDLLAPGKGFRFLAREGSRTAMMGEEMNLKGPVTLEVHSPHRAHIRLLRDGQVVARTWGKGLRFRAHEPGVYRVEAYRPFLLRKRGWVFTNPIYLRA